MRLEILDGLFRENNPGGWVREGSRSGTLRVLFTPNGKVYTYRSTVYALAERFELIPDIDLVTETARIARELETAESVVGYSGCGDTLRGTYNRQVIETYNVGSDDFDRPLSSYRIGSDGWV